MTFASRIWGAPTPSKLDKRADNPGRTNSTHNPIKPATGVKGVSFPATTPGPPMQLARIACLLNRLRGRFYHVITWEAVGFPSSFLLSQADFSVGALACCRALSVESRGSRYRADRERQRRAASRFPGQITPFPPSFWRRRRIERSTASLSLW